MSIRVGLRHMARGAVAVPPIPTDAYRKSHEIKGSTVGAQTDYPVEIKVLAQQPNFTSVFLDSVTGFWLKPSIIYRNGVLFVAAISDGDVLIRAINTETNEYSSVYTIASPGVTDQAYKAPAIGVLPDGKLIVFYDVLTLLYKISTNSASEISSDLTLLNDWGVEQTYGETKLYYHNVASFSDKIVLMFTLQTTHWTDITAWIDTFDGSAWSGKVKLQNHISNGYYTAFHKIDSYILAWGEARLNAPIAGVSENIFFTYSDDKGATWKEANGDVIALPMTEEHKVITSSYVTNVMGTILDENNKPIIIYTYKDSPADLTGDYNVKLATYSSAIGTAGTWTAANITDQGDNPILSEMYYEGYSIVLGKEGRPVIYIKEHVGANHYLRRYVRQVGETSKFTLDTDLSDTTEYSAPAGWDDDVVAQCPVFDRPDTIDVEMLVFEKPDAEPTRNAVIRPALIPSDEVYCNISEADFGDVRFTASDGITPLDYWIKEKVDGDYASFWVNIPSIPADPDTITIYIYYGKPDASTTSNISDTFPFGDDFDGSAEPPEGWTENNIDGGLTWSDLTENSKYKVYNFQDSSAAWHGNEIYKSATPPTTFALVAKHVVVCSAADNKPQHESYLEGYLSSVLKYIIGFQDQNIVTIGRIRSVITGTEDSESDSGVRGGATYTFEIRRDGTNIKTYWNGNLQQTKAETDTIDEVRLRLVGGESLSSSDPQTEVEYVFIRNYVDPEPTHEAWGSEEAVMWPF